MRSHDTVRLVLTALALAVASPSFAQDFYEFLPTGSATWNDDNNWLLEGTGNFVPNADTGAGGFSGESARISSGGTATVTNSVPTPTQIEVITGAVDIQTGGQLGTVIDGGNGSLTVGGAGAVNLSSTGNLNIVGNVSNGGTVELTGPGATFTVGGNFSSTGATVAANITNATSHSVISVAGDANLGGTLNVDFSGVSPSVGDTWNLFDASDISGGYNSVNSTGGLPSGVSLFFQTQAGGTNGVLGQVTADVQLVLSVNPRTGATSIENRATGENVNLDGYLIKSGAGALDPGSWSSLSSGDSNWTESNPGTNSLGELNLTSSSTLAGESSFDLGNVYDFNPTAIGQAEPGLTFDYHSADGRARTGVVEFDGPRNNIVLLVDPETGDAAIQNQSTFSVDIDGYLVTSASNALDTSWTSLATSQGGGWTESNPAANHIGELNLDGSQAMIAGTAPISLGSLFDFDGAGVEQDLEFEFHTAGGDTMSGIVLYGEFSLDIPFLPGDYNANGVVDAADYTVWRDNLGQSSAALNGNGTGAPTVSAADYALWKANFGATAGAGSGAAVPEPASLLVLLSSIGLLAIRRRS